MSGERLTRYVVWSPTYPYTEIVCEFGGPTYDVCDWWEVEAANKRDALRLTVKHFLEEGTWRNPSWPTQQRQEGRSPFSGWTVMEADKWLAEQRAER